jgi:wyosine [tRNA(Phe)-imidazoG37] synthetase (radical SAM superfamily)
VHILCIFAPVLKEYQEIAMSTFLFDKTVFGPVISRRLGVSLGINLLPNDSKVCSFDCIYCECGWNPKKRDKKITLPGREEVRNLLREELVRMKSESLKPDVITFAGNGEPTMHPDFIGIIDDTIMVRDEFCPEARIAVLSNSTMLHKPGVIEALKKVDDNILKLDSGITDTILFLDQPVGHFDLRKVVDNLKLFEGNLTIQTMFIRGEFNGKFFDNTVEAELVAWKVLLKEINPKSVMIYTIARDTPTGDLQKVPVEDLRKIAESVKKELGFDVQVSG